MKKASLILRIVALVFLAIAFLTLLLPHTAYINSNAWSGQNYHTSLQVNFFENMACLANVGQNIGSSVWFLITFALSVLFLVLSFPVKVFRRGYFAAMPFIAMIFSIAVTVDMSKVYPIEAYNGLYYRTNLNLTGATLWCILAFILLVVVGILEICIRRKQKRMLAVADGEEKSKVGATANDQNAPRTEQYGQFSGYNPQNGQFSGYNPQFSGQYGGYNPQNAAPNSGNEQPVGGDRPITNAYVPRNDAERPIANAYVPQPTQMPRGNFDPYTGERITSLNETIVIDHASAAQQAPQQPVAQPATQQVPQNASESEYDSIMAEIEKYQRYFEKGIISEAQYNAKRNQLMRKLQ